MSNAPRLKVKNWHEFQHYNDRNPPWIKLHKVLLDDHAFNMLADASKMLLIFLWLIASESKDGTVTSDESEIAFRLRKKTVDLKPLIASGFLVPSNGDASAMLAGASDLLDQRQRERERREEEEAETEASFSIVWKAYGNYGVKAKARTYWRKLNAEDRASITAAIPAYLKCVMAGRTKSQFEGWINPKNRKWDIDWDAALQALGGTQRKPARPSIYTDPKNTYQKQAQMEGARECE